MSAEAEDLKNKAETAITQPEEVAGQKSETTTEKDTEEAVKKIIPPQKSGKSG